MLTSSCTAFVSDEIWKRDGYTMVKDLIHPTAIAIPGVLEVGSPMSNLIAVTLSSLPLFPVINRIPSSESSQDCQFDFAGMDPV